VVFVNKLFDNTENFRLIFVDNGSTEQTATFLRDGAKEERWTLIRSEDNLGIIGGRNLGAKSVKSDYFLNIDNDQYPRKGWLQALHSLMSQGYDIVGSEAWCLLPPKSRGTVMIGGSMHRRDYYPIKHCSRKGEQFTYIGCGGMLIKKTVYDDIGLFDERYSPFYYEDPHFCFSAIKRGYKLGWCHNCPIDHLGHQTINNQCLANKNKQFIKSWRLFQQAWYPYFPEPISTVQG